jgi:hypothetical protein
MPTKKKRVGFIPRQEVMKIIDKLSIENNLSNSKIISILVEEALSIRGIFDKKKGKASQSYLKIEENSDDLSAGHIDLQTYKKFLSFLKFQEMMEEYNK